MVVVAEGFALVEFTTLAVEEVEEVNVDVDAIAVDVETIAVDVEAIAVDVEAIAFVVVVVVGYVRRRDDDDDDNEVGVAMGDGTDNWVFVVLGDEINGPECWFAVDTANKFGGAITEK